MSGAPTAPNRMVELAELVGAVARHHHAMLPVIVRTPVEVLEVQGEPAIALGADPKPESRRRPPRARCHHRPWRQSCTYACVTPRRQFWIDARVRSGNLELHRSACFRLNDCGAIPFS